MIELVVDRLVAKPSGDEEYPKPLADSIETATRVSGGLVFLSVTDSPQEVLSANYACPDCGYWMAHPLCRKAIKRRVTGLDRDPSQRLD